MPDPRRNASHQIDDRTRPMPPFALGGWTVEPSLNRLVRQAQEVHVEPRLMRVLEVLADRPGTVVTRTELLDLVWSDAHVGEETLTVTVSQLRRILGDDARAPKYIETIPKGGYRLVADVRPLEATRSPSPNTWVRWQPWVLVSIVFLAAILITQTLSRTGHGPDGKPTPTPAVILSGVPLTSSPAGEFLPAVSHDGTRVAFVRDGEIYVIQRNAERPHRLTGSQQHASFPTWSPDGTAIAFTSADDETGIFVVPSLGGTARRVATVEPLVGGLDWSPNGRLLAFSAGTDPQLPYLIAVCNLTTGEIRQLTEPQPDFTCDSWPAFSPDGSTIAFVRAGYGVQQDIFLVPTSGGEPRQLTFFQRRIRGLDWTADGSGVVFSAAPSGSFGLWRVAVDSGELTWLPTLGGAPTYPSLAADGSCLVYQEVTGDRDVFEASLDPETGVVGTPTELLSSTRIDTEAVVSPDGRQIAFVSTRSGSHNLWVSNRDGGTARPVTELHASHVGGPGWSPDGSQVAFTASPDGWASVHVVTTRGEAPQRLGPPRTHEVFSTWSWDGRWLYFSRNVGSSWEIWRMQPDGNQAEKVTATGLHAVADTPDLLLVLKSLPVELWGVAHTGGREHLILGEDRLGRLQNCRVVGSELWVVQRTAQGSRIVAFDLDTGAEREISPGPLPGGANFSFTADGRNLVFDRAARQQSDVILVEGPF